MPPQPEFGALIRLHESTYDWRDHVDGKPIHNGERLEWWNGTALHLVRYEHAGRANAFLVIDDAGTTQARDRASMCSVGRGGRDDGCVA
jgi:hypothetical protein